MKPSSSSARVLDARLGAEVPAGAAAAIPFKHRRTILSAVEVEVPREDPPAGYGFALAMLAAFLVLIGALYVALVAFLGWLFIWHVYQGVESLGRGPYFLFHFPMALLGGLLLLFLIKPVFFRARGRDDGVIAVTAEDEPLLFDFVGKLCDATGARRPAIIEVDCDPNAGARLMKTGVTGALSGNELVLRFGLPLAAAMTVRQFAGVLAHELGHFNQRGGMRGSLLIRIMVAFFAKVVFQRDRLDLKLHRMRRSGSAAGRIVFWAAAWLIEAARGVLWVLVVLGELMTCGVLRRMEYDADRVEAHVAGCREFTTTSRLMLFLSLAARRARADVADAWEQRRLADDMPRLIVAHAKQLAEHKDDILKLLDEQTTGVFDTHPCHNDRVAAVNETGAEGLVACDVGAKHLFRDFGATCRRATESLYRAIVGDALDEGKLVPVSELVEQRRGEKDSFAALRRFFRNGAAPSRPILPASDAGLRARPGGEDAELRRELARARQEMLALAPLAAEASEQFEVSNATLVVSHAKVKFATMLASAASVQMSTGAQRDIQAHEPMRLRAVHNLIGFEKAARRRLTAALRLAQTPPWCDPAQVKLPPAAGGGSADARTVAHLTKVCQLLQPHVEKVEKLRELSLNLGVLMSAYDPAQPYPPLVRRILQADADVIETLKLIRPALADVPYPFAHATAGISVGAALLTKFPDPQDPGDCHGAARSVIERFYDLLYRALAELTTHAERIERGIGLEALPDVPAREEEEKQKREAARAEELAEGKRDARRYWTGYGLRAAGGVCLLSTLVWLSVSPPELPSMGWPSGGGSSMSRDSGYRPIGFGASRRTYLGPGYRNAPAPAYAAPGGRMTASQAARRRLMGPQVDPSVPSMTTTPEQMEQIQQQRRRPSYAGESPNEPRVRYVGPQPTGPGAAPRSSASPGGKR